MIYLVCKKEGICMKCVVLCDNNTLIDRYYLAEPAFCLYLEEKEDRILFDTGYSDVFMINAEKMGIDLSKVNKIVFSHGHNDHTGGLVYFKQKYGLLGIEIYAHPDTFKPRQFEGLSIGSPLSLESLEQSGAILKISKKTMKIADNLFFLGEIEPKCKFEKRYSIGTMKNKEDYMLDDTGIVYKCNNGLVIMSGCSHSGICSIIETAKMITNESKIHAILGGFHLFDKNERLFSTISYLKACKAKKIIPCHCASLNAKIEIGKVLDIEEIGSGTEFHFD